jgi:hypothetical protein
MLELLYEKGYQKVVIMTEESDTHRVKAITESNNNVMRKSDHFYTFNKIIVESVNTKELSHIQYNAVLENDFTKFAQNLPQEIDNETSRNLFNKIREGYGLPECKSFRTKVDVKPRSATRESYVRGEIFELDQYVVVKESGDIAKIKYLGSNYLIIENENGSPQRVWLEAVDPIDIANQKIEKEKMSDARRHDSMLDKARLRKAKQDNRETRSDARKSN